MKLTLTTMMAIVVLAQTGMAGEADGVVSTGHPTAAEVAAKRAAFVAKNGGYVLKPGTPKGRILVVDCQKFLAPSNIVVALNSLGKDFAKWDIVCQPGTVPADGFATGMEAIGADVAVFIVDDGITPGLLTAPDEHWAAVNVRRLSDGLASPAANARFLEARCRKQIMRAVALACGGAGSTYPDNIMDAVRTSDLDRYEEFIPGDKFDICDRYLNDLGMRPKVLVTYRKACREGWAPPPTNDVQKAIWEKAHSVPKNPMKIEFDKKKGK